MKRFLIAAVLLVLVLLFLLFALKLYVMSNVLDKDGMENPFPEDAGSLNGPGDAADILWEDAYANTNHRL